MSFHGFTGQRTGQAPQKQGFSQASTRHTVISYDQDGRRFSWQADNHNGMPTSPLMPDFSAPFLPDSQYLIVNPDNTNEVYVDYPAMYRDRAITLRAYHREATRWSVKHNRPAPKMGDYSDELTEAIGRPPRALELVAAAAQKNPWVLGFSDVPDPRLTPFLEHTTTAIEEIMETFDFSEESYNDAVQGRVGTQAKRQEKPRPRRYTSFANLAELEKAAGVSAEDAAGSDPVLEVAEAALEDAWNDMPDVSDEPQEDEALYDIEDEADAEALGGRTVAPENTERAKRQAPRRATQTAVARKRGRQQSRVQRAEPGSAYDPAKRPSIADGAKPYIPDAE